MKKNLIIAVYFLVFWIVIPGAILILSITLDRVIFNNQKLQDAFFAPGLILTISGFLLLLIAIYQFKQQSGEYPVLHTPPDHIIRKNIFAIWRHPIYLFASFTLLGASMILRSYSASFILFPSFMLLVCFYIRKEESILVKRFGRDYIYHKNNVPILIPYLHHWLKIPESLLFKLWFRLKIHNRENIPDSVPFIVISGHRHYFDPRFISYAMNYPLTHISTLEMFRVRIIRKLFIWFGVIPRKRFLIDVSGTRKILYALKRGNPVCMFPEGGRTWTGKLRPLKPESLKLLKYLKNIPIVPVRIEGNYHSWPRWADHLMRSDITISFEKPVWIGNEVDIEKLGNKLLKMISPDNENERKINCKSKIRIYRLSKIIYRCPICFSIHLQVEIPPDKLRCRQCGIELFLRSDFVIEYTNNEQNFSESIHSLYNKIRIKYNDIYNLFPEQLPEELKKSLSQEEKLIYSASCQLWIEDKTIFRNHIKGFCVLSDIKIKIFGNEEFLIIPLREIGGVMIESNYKLQVYNEITKSLYQMTFEEDSALKWRDMIEVFLRFQYKKEVITR